MQIFKTILKSILAVIIASSLGVVGLLFATQHAFIYHPRHSGAGAEPGIALAYSTSEGRQVARYIPPETGGERAPDRLWVMFCGNSSTGLDWLDFVRRYPGRRDGFLLVDYPGYGHCDGSASPRSILESTESAFDLLARELHADRAALERKLGVVGHSLGCATGLEFAARHPVDRVVLISPFTSLRDMARMRFGWPLCWLLLHNFDNRARLAGLSAREHPPRVSLFHGADDEVIPVRMGGELATAFPAMIVFHPVAGANHNTVLVLARDRIFSAMQQP